MSSSKDAALPHLLVTGAGGLLGGEVVRLVKGECKPYCHFHQKPEFSVSSDCFVGDLGDQNHIRELSEKINPDIIINCAALADVDRCQKEPELSERINVAAVAYLLKSFPRARFVHISTDYVFPQGTKPPSPNDPKGPLNTYGCHKLAGEELVQEKSPDNLIIRTNTMYSHAHKRNFFHFIFTALKEGDEIKGITDQSSNPLAAFSAAQLILQLVRKNAKGTFHIGGREYVSRYEFACRIADYFHLDRNLILPVTSASLSRVAPRLLIGGLDCQETEKFLGIKMPTIESDLASIEERMEKPS